MKHDPGSPAAARRPRPEEAAFDWAHESGELPAVRRELQAILQRRRRRRHRVLGAAAALMLVAGGAWSAWRTLAIAPEVATAARIAIVPPPAQTLADGSRVLLRPGARFEVRFETGTRRVALLEGEVYFEVAKDTARPFVVEVRGVGVRALGTAFSVDAGAGAVEVVVTEGRVAVEHTPASSAPEVAPARLATLDPGERAVVIVNPERAVAAEVQLDRLSAEETDRRLAWRSPRFEFSGTPLRDVVAAFNRHARVRLVLGDPALETLEISGVLRADNLASLLNLLAGEFGVRAETQGDKTVLRR